MAFSSSPERASERASLPVREASSNWWCELDTSCGPEKITCALSSACAQWASMHARARAMDDTRKHNRLSAGASHFRGKLAKGKLSSARPESSWPLAPTHITCGDGRSSHQVCLCITQVSSIALVEPSEPEACCERARSANQTDRLPAGRPAIKIGAGQPIRDHSH